VPMSLGRASGAPFRSTGSALTDMAMLIGVAMVRLQSASPRQAAPAGLVVDLDASSQRLIRLPAQPPLDMEQGISPIRRESLWP
jgi:hypothetical protein